MDPVNGVLCLGLPCSNGLRGIALCRMRALRLDSYPLKGKAFPWVRLTYGWFLVERKAAFRCSLYRPINRKREKRASIPWEK